MSKIKDFYLKYIDVAEQIAITMHGGRLRCSLEQAHLMNRHQFNGHHEVRFDGEEAVWDKCLDQGYFMQLKFKTQYMKKSENYWQKDSVEKLCFTLIADTEERLIEEFEKYVKGIPCVFIPHPDKAAK